MANISTQSDVKHYIITSGSSLATVAAPLDAGSMVYDPKTRNGATYYDAYIKVADGGTGAENLRKISDSELWDKIDAASLRTTIGAGTKANITGSDTTAHVWTGDVLKSALDDYVTLATDQTITGTKTVADENLIQSLSDQLSYNLSSFACAPQSYYVWHDHFAFLKSHQITSVQKSTDGSTWTTSSLNIRPLFIEKEFNEVTILGASDLAFRFTINSNNFHACQIAWFSIGVNYSNPYSATSVLVESSADNSTWTRIHNSVVNANSTTKLLRCTNMPNNQKYIRFTFTKTSNTTTGTVKLNSIKALTARKGNQGLGRENEFPYTWDDIPNVTFPANVSATKFYGALEGNVTGNCSGTAGSVAWANVSSKPTKLSDFTDDLGSSPTHTHSQYLPLAGGTMTGNLTIGSTSTNKNLEVHGAVVLENTAVGGALEIWRRAQGSYCSIKYSNGTTKTVLGQIGITNTGDTALGSQVPYWGNGSSTYKLTYVSANSTTAVGGTTTPVYVDTNGQIKAGTSLGTASTHVHGDYVTAVGYDSSSKKITWSKGGTAQTAFEVGYAATAGNASSANYATTAGSADSVDWSNISSVPNFATVATSGSYNDLTNKPTIPAAANNGTFSIKTKVGTASAVTAADFTANQSSADDVTFIQGSNVTLTTDTTNRTITIAATDTTYESKAAASGGTALSLVTTGEKYTWNNKSNLALGTTSTTAYYGDKGKTAYDHSQLTSGNPHGVTKTDVGLGNVGNFKAVSTVASQGLTSTEQSNARANIGAGTSSLTIGTSSTTAAAGNHNHDSVYLKLTGGTVTGTLNIAADASNYAAMSYSTSDSRLEVNAGLYINGNLNVEDDIYEGTDKLSDKYAAKSHNHDSTYIAKTLTSTKGDIIYASAANTPARLAIGSAGKFLTVSNGVPAWGSLPGMGASGTNHKAGLVPDPGATAGTTKYLREDGAWMNPVSGYATQTWVNNKGYYKSGDSPTFGSWLQLESSSGDPVYLDANEDMSSLTGIYGDTNVTGLQIENIVYIQEHLVVENEVYAGDYRSFSDRRLKNHIADFRLSLEDMATLSLARYTYKKRPEAERVGTYAQEVQKILPQAVSEVRDGMLSLDYNCLNTAVSLSLVQEVKELKARIAELENQLKKVKFA